ncbi:MAG: glycosyltransferase family 2 protein [Alphaproteobacteria bacterium]
MTAPLVSVVVPVFNGAQFLRAALDSVFAQDYPHIDVVAVDDGSTDATAEILAAEPRLRAVRQPNRGVAAARNAGIDAARGDFVAFVDSDDLWRPNKLRRQLELFAARPGIGYCFTLMRNFRESGIESLAALPSGLFDRDLPGMCPSTTMFARDVLKQAGRFDETMRRGEDLDYFSRLIDLGVEFGLVNELLVDRRIHGGNLTLDIDASIAAMLRAVRQSVLRKRASTVPGTMPAKDPA